MPESQFPEVPMLSQEPAPAPGAAANGESSPVRDAIRDAIAEHRVLRFM